MDVKERTLHVTMCHNEDFSPLARHCCRTISHENIRMHRILQDIPSEGFRSPGWYRFTRMKVEMLRVLLDFVEDGDVVGMTDCDIQFFSPERVLEARDMMIASEYDYVGLAEACCSDQKNLFAKRSGDTNTGFVLLRKCRSSFDFLSDVLAKSFEEKYLGDQGVINESLNSTGLNCALLNPCLFFHGWCGDPKAGMIAHHATGTHNLKQKMAQIDWVREKIGLGPVDWADPSFGTYK